MDRKTLLFALGGLVLMAIAVFAFRGRFGGAGVNGNPDLAAAIGRIEANQDRLAERLDRLESLNGRSGNASSAAFAGGQVSPSAIHQAGHNSGVVDIPVADQEARTARQRLAMEDRLISDPLSPRWATSNEKTIGDFLSASNLAKQQLPVPKAVQTQCHSHLCRINMNFADADLAGQTQTMLLTEIAPTLPNAVTFQVPRPDGSTDLLIFAGDPQYFH